jgi:hypothetical protein
MKTRKYSRLLSLAGTVLFIAALSGCKDLFKDPLTDKETGEDVTLLLIDRNFIKTKIAVRLQDNATLQDIDQEEVEVRCFGDDANNLITFAGFKQTVFITSSGFVEIGLDPNIPVTDQNPVELTVVAVSPNYVSVPQFVSYTADGIKNLTIRMIHKPSGKSATSGPYGEPFDISYNGMLHSPQLVFLSDIRSQPTGTAWEYLNMYTTTINGIILCSNLTDNVLYSDYGAYFYSLSTGHSLLPPALAIKNAILSNGDFVYSSILRTGMAKCQTGLTIHVSRADGKPGTGVFGYVVTFADGKTKTGQITCTFPSDNRIEPVYYPSSNPAVSVVLTGDSQYNISGAVNLPSACGATASFTASPKTNLANYKFIVQYSCPDTPVGMGLSILGEFRKTGSTGAWTSFEFIEGVCDLQLEPNSDYEFRVNIDSKYYNYTLPTDPAQVGPYLTGHQNEDYTLRQLTITDSNAVVVIFTDVQFSQGVCDAIR